MKSLLPHPAELESYNLRNHAAYQTDANNALLASYTYDSAGTPVSVAVGPDPTNPTTTPRYWYVYNGHGDVVNLVDASGNIAASYAYDTWGAPTSVSEAIPNANGWVNPYRYDGRDGVRYDAADGLYWMAVRAYDPTIGRFISHDPLGRAPLFLASDNPYVYAGNNPVSNVDPSGERYAMGNGSSAQVKALAPKATHMATPVHTQWGGRANAYRLKVVARLDDVAYWLGLASLGMFIVGDGLSIFYHAKADEVINVLVDLSDLAGQVVEFIHQLGIKAGRAFIDLAERLRPAVEAISTFTSTLRGLLQLPFVGPLIQASLSAIVNWIVPGLEGPIGIGLSLAETTLGGAFADLIRAGGHALAYIQTQVEQEARSDLGMPIAQFCKQDGGCPRG